MSTPDQMHLCQQFLFGCSDLVNLPCREFSDLIITPSGDAPVEQYPKRCAKTGS